MYRRNLIKTLGSIASALVINPIKIFTTKPEIYITDKELHSSIPKCINDPHFKINYTTLWKFDNPVRHFKNAEEFEKYIANCSWCHLFSKDFNIPFDSLLNKEVDENIDIDEALKPCHLCFPVHMWSNNINQLICFENYDGYKIGIKLASIRNKPDSLFRLYKHLNWQKDRRHIVYEDYKKGIITVDEAYEYASECGLGWFANMCSNRLFWNFPT